MGSERKYTSSGSKSRNTRGAEPSQDDVRKELRDTGIKTDRDSLKRDGTRSEAEQSGTRGEDRGSSQDISRH